MYQVTLHNRHFIVLIESSQDHILWKRNEKMVMNEMMSPGHQLSEPSMKLKLFLRHGNGDKMADGMRGGLDIFKEIL